MGESWICWNYPYPREVSVILISLPAELIHASELELLGYVEEGDSFLDVEIEIQRCKDLTLPAGQENFVLVIVKVFIIAEPTRGIVIELFIPSCMV